MKNFALEYAHLQGAERVAKRQAEIAEKMKVEGSHLLSGAPYWSSDRGSRILAPIIARVKARDAA
jgi:hypothetical protein